MTLWAPLKPGQLANEKSGAIHRDLFRWLMNMRDRVNNATDALLGLGAITGEPTGFEDRDDSIIAFNGTTRAFGISPAVTSYDIYLRGRRFNKNRAESITLADTTGTHFIWFDSNGELATSTTPWDFDEEKVFVATVYRRAAGTDYVLGDERHGLTMDWATHQYLHETIGARYESGLSGSFTTANTFTLTAGGFHDEDLHHVITAQTTCRRWWRDGSGYWNFSAAGTGYYTETAGVIQYDDGDGTPADVTAANYVACWIFATNDPTTPIWSVMGQRVDATLAAAQTNNTLANLVLTNLPSPEMKLLYRVLLKRNGAAEIVSEVTDYRATSIAVASTSTVPAHNSLVGLDSGFHVPLKGIVWADLSAADIADATKFDGTGLGVGQYLGFAICNGSNGTRNLGAYFLRSSTSAAGGTGGSDTASHTHTLSNHTHGAGDIYAKGNTGGNKIVSKHVSTSAWIADSHLTGVSGGDTSSNSYGWECGGTSSTPSDNNSGTTAPDNKPPYIDLVPLMRVV